MIPESIPVFLNGRPVRMTPGATLGQLLAQEDPDLAMALDAGLAKATDARGLPVMAATPLSAGAIFRVFPSGRAPSAAADA